MALAGSIPARFNAFDIPVVELDSSDVLQIWSAAKTLVDTVRSTSSPQALVLNTCRFGPHSKGDDTRPADEIADMRRIRDPLSIHATRLDPPARQKIEQEIDREIAQAFQQALADPFPTVTP